MRLSDTLTDEVAGVGAGWRLQPIKSRRIGKVRPRKKAHRLLVKIGCMGLIVRTARMPVKNDKSGGNNIMATLALKTNRFGWLLSKLGLNRPIRLDVHTAKSMTPKPAPMPKSETPMTPPMPPMVDVMKMDHPSTTATMASVATSSPPTATAVPTAHPGAAAPQAKEFARRESGGRDGDNNGDDGKPQSLLEMTGLIRSVRGQLNRQSDRSQRIMELMQTIPESISTLPEINRNQKRLVEAVNMQLQLDEKHNAELSRSMKSLLDLGERQTQMMGLMQQRMDLTQQTDAKVVGGLKAVNQTLCQVGEAGLTQTQTLRELLEHRRVSDQRLEHMVMEQARTGRAMMIANWVMAAAALGVAVWAMMG